jgi:hypothetical protein
MPKGPVGGMVMGAIAVVLGLFNLISDQTGAETPPASIGVLNYVLLGLGLLGFLGSLVAYLRQKSSS